MTSPRITFTYGGGNAVVDPWWVRLEQENIPDDTATLRDAADLLDTLYNLDPCADENELATDPEEAAVDETVEITVDRVACRFDADGNIDVTLRVIRSRQDAPYKLALQGGTLLTTETIRETITKTIEIESAASHTLDYPVIDGFTAAWRGTVYGKQGRVSPSTIARTGNTLSFDEVASGSITATYLTEYDRCTVTILGVNGEPGECVARVFFHGLVDELPLEIPEASEPIGRCTARWQVMPADYDIECYREVTVSTRCQCTDAEIRSRMYEETVPCPEEVVRCQGARTSCRHLVGAITVPEYVECADDNEIPGRPGTVYALSTAKYYEDRCCKKPSFALPDCPEKTTTHRGGLPLKGGTRPWFDIWGPKLRITPISPPGGICGNWTIRQQIVSSNCCDGVEPLVWDTTVSPEVMTPNSSVVIGVTGGRGPYHWSVDGTGFQFTGGLTVAQTAIGKVWLSALVGACGTATITVSDGCSSITGEIRSTSGGWMEVIENTTGGIPCLSEFSGQCSDKISATIWEKVSGKYKLQQTIEAQFTQWVWGGTQADAIARCQASYASQMAAAAAECTSGTTSACPPCFHGSTYEPCRVASTLTNFDPQWMSGEVCDNIVYSYVYANGNKTHRALVTRTYLWEWRC